MTNPQGAQTAPQIMPLGGCGEFGMNMTLYRQGGRTYVIDAGSRFPLAFQSGVDCIIPDVQQLFESFGGITAYIITHGHEDHIGALPFIYRKWPADIFAPPWAATLITRKFLQNGLPIDRLHVVRSQDRKDFGSEAFTWLPLNHSIPDAYALLIEMGDVKVFHTGDYKIDPLSVYEEPADLGMLTSIGDKGIDLLIADSTNAHRPGRCPSETVVKDGLRKVFEQAQGLTVVATFSSNLWRLMIVFELCKEMGKKLCIVGRGLENTLEIAAELKMFYPPAGVIIDTNEVGNYARNDVVVLATGCQGERLAGLARIVAGHIKSLVLNELDQIVFSSRVIPGNEMAILNITNYCEKIGCQVINNFPGYMIHVSGHGYQEDLGDLLTTIRPRFFLPMHGSYFHLRSNNDTYTQRFPSVEKTYLTDTGNVFELTKSGLNLVSHHDLERRFIDQGSRLEMDYLTLKQRLKVGERGQIVFAGIFDSQSGQWQQEPQMKVVGMTMPAKADSDAWREKLYKRLAASVGQYLAGRSFDQEALNEHLRIDLRSKVDEVLHKKPEVSCQVFVV